MGIAMRTVRRLVIEHFDKNLQSFQRALHVLRDAQPSNGWIAGLRSALGMTERALASRMRVTQPTLRKLEKREREDTITLGSLRRAADALDADLVYALIPRRKLRDAITAQAQQVAEARMRPIARTMQLEGQALTTEQLRQQTDDLARELEAHPNKLWR
jgi:predicted DNA-binding mobile mystery protein A